MSTGCDTNGGVGRAGRREVVKDRSVAKLEELRTPRRKVYSSGSKSAAAGARPQSIGGVVVAAGREAARDGVNEVRMTRLR